MGMDSCSPKGEVDALAAPADAPLLPFTLPVGGDCWRRLDVGFGNLVTPQNEAEHRATECDLKIRWHEVRESNQPSIVRAS